ncbi:unnamed protein product [Amoebophrya sp. A25]|nr:unnamed protein product [Amoebophrya sp. A25]|eukprot:GSA25T00023010001.1
MTKMMTKLHTHTSTNRPLSWVAHLVATIGTWSLLIAAHGAALSADSTPAQRMHLDNAEASFLSCMETDTQIAMAYRPVHCITDSMLRNRDGKKGLVVFDVFLGWGGYLSATWRAAANAFSAGKEEGERGLHAEEVQDEAEQHDPTSKKKLFYLGFESERWNVESLVYPRAASLCRLTEYSDRNDARYFLEHPGSCALHWIDLVSEEPPSTGGRSNRSHITKEDTLLRRIDDLEEARRTRTRQLGVYADASEDDTPDTKIGDVVKTSDAGTTTSSASSLSVTERESYQAPLESLLSSMMSPGSVAGNEKFIDLLKTDKQSRRFFHDWPMGPEDRLVEAHPLVDGEAHDPRPHAKADEISTPTSTSKMKTTDSLRDYLKEEVFNVDARLPHEQQEQDIVKVSGAMIWGAPYPRLISEKLAPYAYTYTASHWSDSQREWIEKLLQRSSVKGEDVAAGMGSDVDRKTNAGSVPIVQACEVIRETGLPLVILFDGKAAAMAMEWALIEKYCQPDFLFLNNINLPDHPGWIRERLLLASSRNEARWHDVYVGEYDDDDAGNSGDWLRSTLYGKRHFALLRQVK